MTIEGDLATFSTGKRVSVNYTPPSRSCGGKMRDHHLTGFLICTRCGKTDE